MGGWRGPRSCRGAPAQGRAKRCGSGRRQVGAGSRRRTAHAAQQSHPGPGAAAACAARVCSCSRRLLPARRLPRRRPAAQPAARRAVPHRRRPHLGAQLPDDDAARVDGLAAVDLDAAALGHRVAAVLGGAAALLVRGLDRQRRGHGLRVRRAGNARGARRVRAGAGQARGGGRLHVQRHVWQPGKQEAANRTQAAAAACVPPLPARAPPPLSAQAPPAGPHGARPQRLPSPATARVAARRRPGSAPAARRPAAAAAGRSGSRCY